MVLGGIKESQQLRGLCSPRPPGYTQVVADCKVRATAKQTLFIANIDNKNVCLAPKRAK
jgi:hypothetical protein